MKRLFALLTFIAVAAGSAGVANAAQLLMMEQPGCAWCKRWHEEIGAAYPKTKEGRIAPIRFVDITEPWPEDLAGIRRERMTPTFVLLDDGVEVARLRGYPGDQFFWPLLDEMLQELPHSAGM